MKRMLMNMAFGAGLAAAALVPAACTTTNIPDDSPAAGDDVAAEPEHDKSSLYTDEFYPIGDDWIQMERCKGATFAGANVCDYYCIQRAHLVNSAGPDLVDAVFSARTRSVDAGTTRELERAMTLAGSSCKAALKAHPDQTQTRAVTAKAKVVKPGPARLAGGKDTAASYRLDGDGHLWRTIGYDDCPVTNDVSDFKISANPDDPVLAYVVKYGHLIAVNEQPGAHSGCPVTTTKLIMPNLAKNSAGWTYSVVPAQGSPVASAAINVRGQLYVWDTATNAADQLADGPARTLTVNACFGANDSLDSHIPLFVAAASGKGYWKIEATNQASQPPDANLTKASVGDANTRCLKARRGGTPVAH